MSETDREGATGRVSQGVSGTTTGTGSGAGAAPSPNAVDGAQVERTTLGNTAGTSSAASLDLGEGAAGGLGLHGDREARLRTGVTGPTGSADPSDAARGTPSGPAAAANRAERAEGADGSEAGSGLRGTVATAGDRADDTAASPDAQDGTTTPAIGGTTIDRVTTGQGGDVGGSLTGPG